MDGTRLEALMWSGAEVVGVIGASVLLGLGAYAVLFRLIRRATRGMEGPIREALLRRLPSPLRLLVPVLFVYAALPLFRVDAAPLLRDGLYVVLVGSLAWGLVRLLEAGEEAAAGHFSIDTPDNLKARKIVTQVRILRRIATAIVLVLAVGIMLVRYEPVRELGAGLLASAGIVGIIVGVAAQRTLSNVIAGIQIALTQPIRVDDVVIVEGEFGWIEEITLTYVVVRVWDRRRIVLPITHFVEQPFQNWTRTSADLIGTVFLYLDYSVPVDDLREELQRIVEASEHWDGDVVGLQMTDASERTVTLRALASAKDAPTLWDLRCEIRERLVAYIREQYPEALPALRTRLEPPGDGSVALGNDAG